MFHIKFAALSEPLTRAASAMRLRHVEWFLIFALFLLAGAMGHDPWKQDETYTFGIVHHFLTTNSWLVPVNADFPFLEKPPLYYWTAVVFCKIFGGLMPLPDAARLASVFYTSIAAVFMWRLSQLVFAARQDRVALGWLSLALMLGSAGLIRHIHDMFSDVGLLAGAVIALYGMALLFCTQSPWWRSGAWIGLGIGVAFLTKGVLTPAVFVVSGLILLAALPQARRRETGYALLIAFLVASPFLFIWPSLLYAHSPALFTVWFWDNNIGRFLGFSVATLGAANFPFYMLKVAPSFAFPSFPLAVIALLAAPRAAWRQPAFLLPASVMGVALLVLNLSASARALYYIPFIPAFALLGAGFVGTLPARVHAGWNWIWRVVVSAALAILWLTWSSLQHLWDGHAISALARIYGRWLPADLPPLWDNRIGIAAALMLTLLWLASWRLDRSVPRNTARLWIVGVAAVWGVMFTLLMPWVEVTKSYRGLAAEITAASDATGYDNRCLAMTHYDESISPMLQYFTSRFDGVQGFDQTGCPFLLEKAAKDAPIADHPRWRFLWRGHRPLDTKDEELRLYVEKSTPALDPDNDGDVDVVASQASCFRLRSSPDTRHSSAYRAEAGTCVLKTSASSSSARPRA